MFAVLVMLSIVRTPIRSKALRTVAIVEVLPVIAGAAALTFAELWHDVNVSMLATAPRMSALIYPTLYVSDVSYAKSIWNRGHAKPPPIE